MKNNLLHRFRRWVILALLVGIVFYLVAAFGWVRRAGSACAGRFQLVDLTARLWPDISELRHPLH